VSTPDAAHPTSPGSDPVDAGLLGLFSLEPGAAVLERLDERVERSMIAWQPASALVAGRRRLRPGRRAGVLGLLAAVLVVGGASGGLNGLYSLLTGPFGTVPWERGEPVNVSDVVDGYRVTIDRAYADATRLMLAVSVVDELERPGTSQLSAMATVVTDESGTYTSGGGATSGPLGRYAAANVIFKTPPELPLPAGRRQFHVVIPHIEVRDDATPPPEVEEDEANTWNPWHRHAGPWTFDFELTVAGGTVVTPDALAEVDGVGVRVTRLIASPSVVRVELLVENAPAASDWSPIGEVRHGSRVLPFVMQSLGADGPIEILTSGGVDDASGEWTVVIKELVGSGGSGGDVRLAGPWTLRIQMP
jgi:hypothetical protein